MCEVFIGADPHGCDSRTRSVRLHGVVTSIRLENLFWQVLEEIGRRDGMGVVQLIEKLYDELVASRGEVGNFASFLRVSALRYEALQAQGHIPVDPAGGCLAASRSRWRPGSSPTGRVANARLVSWPLQDDGRDCRAS